MQKAQIIRSEIELAIDSPEDTVHMNNVLNFDGLFQLQEQLREEALARLDNNYERLLPRSVDTLIEPWDNCFCEYF